MESLHLPHSNSEAAGLPDGQRPKHHFLVATRYMLKVPSNADVLAHGSERKSRLSDNEKKPNSARPASDSLARGRGLSWLRIWLMALAGAIVGLGGILSATMLTSASLLFLGTELGVFLLVDQERRPTHQVTGSSVRPPVRRWLRGRSSSTGTAKRSVGKRWNSAPNTVCSSIRASGAPMQ